MKKLKTFLVLLFIVTVTTAFAQPRAGIKGGVNISQLTGYVGGNLAGFHAGFFVNTSLSKSLSVHPELIYSGEGQKYIFFLEEEIPVDATIGLGYVHLPVMFQFYPTKQFYIETGPQLGVLVTAASKVTEGEKLNVKRSFTNTQFAWNLGLGLNMKNNIGFYARYNYGLSDITLYNNEKDYSRVVNVGIKISFKK